jgi:hypothetical protein
MGKWVMVTLSGPNWTFSCDDMPDECGWCEGGPCRFAPPDAPINVLLAEMAKARKRIKAKLDKVEGYSDLANADYFDGMAEGLRHALAILGGAGVLAEFPDKVTLPLAVMVHEKLTALLGDTHGNADMALWEALTASLRDAVAEIVRLREAVDIAKREIRVTVEHATDIMNDMGRGADPAERTYAPIIARIDRALGDTHDPD